MDRANDDVLRWYTSSHSEEEDCVEVAVTRDAVLVRHSWNRDWGHIVFSRAQWQTFVDALGTPDEGGGGAG
ncbi:DUF397 domain-containing protein [Streptomyces sp. HGB0020]|uniref:DUF397 domain-containing protein n=1 Tax=Streptomyces sp. HGB0020 TaxID=1078086 RepID=UPI00034E5CA1|nr:DUF397 domain-containing protein [Streptomyces sp. HGB0020]EPD57998.1 hypothetical protein HMPREF1211_06336 [Streptomyces sp. HGB0020]